MGPGEAWSASQSSGGLAGSHYVISSVLMQLVEDGNLAKLGILSGEAGVVALPLLTLAFLPSKDFWDILA